MTDTEITIPSTNKYFPAIKELGATLHIPTDAPPSKRIVVIVHGHAGHRDYCYQRSLAHTLPIASIRFDFSGCGYQLGQGTPAGEESSEIPRVIESDLIDLATIMRWVRSEGYQVAALVGHSRGGVVCLRYATIDHSIPTVVNCSGRFRGHLILDKVRNRPNFDPSATGYFEKQRAGPGGALVDKWTLMSEIESVGQQEMVGLRSRLSSEQEVCCVFGSRDVVVPVSDCGMFVNELREQCSVFIVDDADHNFFIQPDPPRHPKRVNRNDHVATIIADYLSDEASRLRFLDRHRLLPSPRFIPIDGMTNLRDVGGYAGKFPLGWLYRSADLSDLTKAGAAQLGMLVDTIIDIRSDPEVSLNGDVGPAYTASVSDRVLLPSTVTRRHVPIFKKVDYSPAGMAKFFGHKSPSPRKREDGMVNAYRSILRHCRPVVREIGHVLAQKARLQPGATATSDSGSGILTRGGLGGRGVLIHCSAGKDRTGVLSMLFLLFAGVSEETVAREYELTTYGLNADPRGQAKVGHAIVQQDPENENENDQEDLKDAGKGSSADTLRRTLSILANDPEFKGIDTYMRETLAPEDHDILKALLTAQHATAKL
ncbi:hypothetical protein PYCC9005_001696 [Savitreella phatthalungensis]